MSNFTSKFTLNEKEKNNIDIELYNDLIEICKNNNIERLNEIFNIKKLNIKYLFHPSSIYGEKNYTLLHYACVCGNDKIVKMIMNYLDYNNINNINILFHQESCGWTPLHLACMKGFHKIVSLYLPKYKDLKKDLHKYIQGQREFYKYFVNNCEYDIKDRQNIKMCIYKKDMFGMTAFTLACCYNKSKVVKIFLNNPDFEYDLNDNKKSEMIDGVWVETIENGIEYAYKCGNIKVIKTILMSKHNIKIHYKKGNFNKEYIEIDKLLKLYKEDPNDLRNKLTNNNYVVHFINIIMLCDNYLLLIK